MKSIYALRSSRRNSNFSVALYFCFRERLPFLDHACQQTQNLKLVLTKWAEIYIRNVLKPNRIPSRTGMFPQKQTCFKKRNWQRELDQTLYIAPIQKCWGDLVQSQTTRGHIQDDISQATQGNGQRGILDLWFVDHDRSGWWYIGYLYWFLISWFIPRNLELVYKQSLEAF